MGLDVYVGTLTRYFSRDWQTILQQSSQTSGIPTIVLRDGTIDPPVPDSDSIRPQIVAWQQTIQETLRDRLSEPFSWDEAMLADYYTDKPDWGPLGSLILWAAYDEHRKFRRPSRTPKEWTKDPAYLNCQNENPALRYVQLLTGVEMWFPVSFEFTVQTTGPMGQPFKMGSCQTLQAQLQDLNNRTWRADSPTLEKWKTGSGLATSILDRFMGPRLESEAQFAFSIFWDLTSKSVEHRLPMVLDY